MTTPSKSELPNLGHVTKQLSANNARILNFLKSLEGSVDELLIATEAKNWEEVAKISQSLALSAKQFGYIELATSANQAVAATKDPTNHSNILRNVLRILGNYGRIKSPSK